MKKIEDKCQCYPSYDEQLHKLHRSKPCNFFEHSTCVAKIHNTNDQFEFMKECLPACDHTTVHQEGIHVSQKHLNILGCFSPLSRRKIKYTKMDAGLAKYFRDNAARQLRKANSKVDVDQLGY